VPRQQPPASYCARHRARGDQHFDAADDACFAAVPARPIWAGDTIWLFVYWCHFEYSFYLLSFYTGYRCPVPDYAAG
jgi:hypothetical protein